MFYLCLLIFIASLNFSNLILRKQSRHRVERWVVPRWVPPHTSRWWGTNPTSLRHIYNTSPLATILPVDLDLSFAPSWNPLSCRYSTCPSHRALTVVVRAHCRRRRELLLSLVPSPSPSPSPTRLGPHPYLHPTTCRRNSQHVNSVHFDQKASERHYTHACTQTDMSITSI